MTVSPTASATAAAERDRVHPCIAGRVPVGDFEPGRCQCEAIANGHSTRGQCIKDRAHPPSPPGQPPAAVAGSPDGDHDTSPSGAPPSR